MNNLIAVSGKISSGKDLLVNILQYLYWKKKVLEKGIINKAWLRPFSVDFDPKGVVSSLRYENRKFADLIKDTVCLWIGCTRDQLEDRNFKERPLGPKWWYYLSPNGTKVPYEKDLTLPDSDLVKVTPRMIMQLLGTEGGRVAIHPNIWVNTLIDKYKSGMRWFISDCRFPNEADAVKAKGGLVIRIERPNQITTADGKHMHPSETSLDNYEGFDHVFINDGSIEDLVKKVEEWLEK